MFAIGEQVVVLEQLDDGSPPHGEVGTVARVQVASIFDKGLPTFVVRFGKPWRCPLIEADKDTDYIRYRADQLTKWPHPATERTQREELERVNRHILKHYHTGALTRWCKGEPIVVLQDGKWVDCPSPCWGEDRYYRVKSWWNTCHRSCSSGWVPATCSRRHTSASARVHGRTHQGIWCGSCGRGIHKRSDA